MTIISIYLISINIISLLLMGIDKFFAIKYMKRISEHTLITLSLFAGCYGTSLGMLIFRHKIRKPKFYITIPILLIIYTSLIITKKIPLF